MSLYLILLYITFVSESKLSVVWEAGGSLGRRGERGWCAEDLPMPSPGAQVWCCGVSTRLIHLLFPGDWAFLLSSASELGWTGNNRGCFHRVQRQLSWDVEKLGERACYYWLALWPTAQWARSRVGLAWPFRALVCDERSSNGCQNRWMQVP